MAKLVDILLVIGSSNSSNSNRLRELGERMGKPSYLIDGPGDMRREWLQGVGNGSGRERDHYEHHADEDGEHHADHGAPPFEGLLPIAGKGSPAGLCRKDKEHTVSATLVPPVWIEQTTCRLQGGCSATELRRRRSGLYASPPIFRE